MLLSGDKLAIARDLNNRFDSYVRKPRANMLYKKVCEIVPSDGAFEKYPMITSVPFPAEWTDMNTPDGIRVTNVLEVDNLMYRQHIEIDANLVADSKAWELNRLLTRAANRCVEFPDKLCSALLDAGVNASTPSITDPTTAFYAATKSFGGLGKNSFSNKLTGTGTTLTALQTDIAAAISALESIKDDEGALVNNDLKMTQDNLLFRFNPALKFVFNQVLNTQWLPLVSAASGENVLKGIGEPYSDGYMVNADDAGTNDWQLHVCAEGYRPFIYQEREKMRSKLYTPNDDKDCDVRNVIAIITSYRFAFAYGFPEHSIHTFN